jgi:predicted DsbA family dithiol-disulfide isomerase
MTDSITMYSDYVCPFCYLGRESLDRYRADREEPLEIDWQPFDLRSHKRGPDGEIDHSVEDGKDDAYFEQVRENVERLQAEYDADEMRSLDELPDEVDSFNAQVGAFFVKQEFPERWEAFDEALFEALWVDGRDIGDLDVLANIAADVGLDGDAVIAAVKDAELRETLRDRFAAAKREGISGVPTFIADQHAARGAVPPEHLARLVEGDAESAER